MRAQDLPKLVAAARDGRATLVIRNAKVLNVFTNEILEADVGICGDAILGVGTFDCPNVYDAHGAYLAPGFIDAHVHIESSMVTPASFAGVILPFGTTTIVADPHEIANVAGTKGLDAIFALAKDLPLDIRFMVPSCVPATPFEHSGATLNAADLAAYLDHPQVLGLGEVMDSVSLLGEAPDMMDKLMRFFSRPIDGHAPLLSGRGLDAYCLAGPMTDHECSNFAELKEKLRNGMRILIRIGSAANGVDEMFRGLVEEGLPTDSISFCTDDKHIENILREGHINHIINVAIAHGISPFDAIRMATLNTARTYGLKRVGAIAPGYAANLVLFDDLNHVTPKAVFAQGKLYDPKSPMPVRPVDPAVLNSVHCAPVSKAQLRLRVQNPMPIIQTVDHQLVTRLATLDVPVDANGDFAPQNGLNKLVVAERHHATGNVGVGIVKGLTLSCGAIAATVAHDSHNIVVAGDNDDDILLAIDAVRKVGGGFCVVGSGKVLALLPLPIARLMSDAPVETVLQGQRDLLRAAKSIGANDESDPLVLLSFLALPVIPEVRLTDIGLFDVCHSAFLYRTKE